MTSNLDDEVEVLDDYADEEVTSQTILDRLNAMEEKMLASYQQVIDYQKALTASHLAQGKALDRMTEVFQELISLMSGKTE